MIVPHGRKMDITFLMSWFSSVKKATNNKRLFNINHSE